MAKVAVNVENGKKKTTTKVDNYTNPANEGMNLSGVNNIQNAVGNVKPKAPVSKPVIQNNEKGKTFVPETKETPTKPVKVTEIVNAVVENGKKNQERLYNEKIAKANEIKSYEANKFLNKSEEERNSRIKANPDYELDLVEFVDGNGNRVGGKEYRNMIQNHNNEMRNIENSLIALDNQYAIDRDGVKYRAGQRELIDRYNQLVADGETLNSYTADYNNSVIDEYENNVQRMNELLNMTTAIKQHTYDGPRGKEVYDQAVEEYLALRDRNEALRTLYDDVRTMKEKDYHNYLLQNGSEEEIREFESYIGSEDDKFLQNRIKALGSNVLKPIYGVMSVVDISRDLLGEYAGNTMESVALDLQEKGFITDEAFDKVSSIAKDFKEFEFDNENNFSQQLREYNRRIQNEITSGNKDELELFAGAAIDSALENYIRYSTLGKFSTLSMALGTLGDSYYENINKGYTPEVAITNSFLKAYLTYMTEKLPTEQYMKLLGTTAGSAIDKQFFSTLAGNLVSMVPQEGIEEGAEYIGDYLVDLATTVLQPGVDNPEFVPGDLYKTMLQAMASTTLSGTMGAVTSALAYENPFPIINNIQEYNQFSAELNNIKSLVDAEADLEARANLQYYVNRAEERIRQFEKESKTAGKMVFESDQVATTNPELATEAYKTAMVPDAISMSNEQEKTDHEVGEATFYLRQIAQATLKEKGIVMNPNEYLLMDDNRRNVINKLSSSFNKVEGNNIQLRFSTRAKKGGEYGVDNKTGQAYILVNPNSNTLITDIFNHEIIHTLKGSPIWNQLKSIADKIAGDNKDAYKERLRNADYKEGVIDEELVAYMLQDEYNTDAFLNELGRKDKTALQKLYNLVTDFVQNLRGSSEADTLARQIAQAYRNVMSNPVASRALSVDIESAKKDYPNVFEKDGKLKDLSVQLKEMEKSPSTHGPSIVDFKNGLEFAEVGQYASLSYNTLKKIISHGISVEQIVKLLDNTPNSAVLGLDYIERNGEQRKSVLLENNGKIYRIGLKQNINEYVVDDIRTLFEDIDVATYVDNAIKKGNKIYLNEKSNAFLEGLIHSSDAPLDGIANFIKTYDDQEVKSNKDIQLKGAENELINFITENEELVEALGLLDGYTGISSTNENLDTNLEYAGKTREEVIRENADNYLNETDAWFERYLEEEDITPDEVDWDDVEGYLGDPYELESTPLEEYRGTWLVNKLAEYSTNYLKERYGNNVEIARANKDIDLKNGLKAQLDPYISSQSDELADVIDQAEEQIVFTGDLTPAMRKSLSDIVYDATFAEEESVDEGITAKDINKFLRENPLKWASLKGDNRMSLVEFQKEHPGVKFAKDGGKDWDVIAGEFDSQFPGLLNPEDYNSAVDFLDKIQALRKDAMGRDNRVPTMSRSEFDEIFDKTLDDFIKANQPKLSQPKEMSESAMRNVEKQREAFRNSVKTWVRDYDVLRNKFDSFDDKTFDDALADVYITGDINPETKKQLVNDVMKNDFEGYYQGNGAKEYVNRFVNEATDYYVLETDYNLNQRYRDTIAKNANIVAQAQNSIYEEEYDRAETARTLDAMAKEVRLRDYDAVYDYVQRIIEGINDKKNILANRDLKEYNDLVSDGDENVRQLFNELLEQPIRTAQREELAILQDEMDTIAKLQEQVGIKMYSKEDEAIGWLLEGKKQDGSEYYISNLKRDFPDKWKDIEKVADYYRDTVERWYNEEVKTRENVYGDMTYQNDVRTARLQTDVESARSILAKREADLRNNPNSKTQAGYSKAQKVLATAEKRLNAQLQRNLEHDSTRRQYTPYRQDYFHHTNEVHFVKNIKALAEMIKNGTQSRKNRIPSELAGRTENTKPKTTIQSYMWRQGEKNYSSSGFASLRHRLVEHANAMAFDPAVSYMRNVEFIFRDLDAENKASNYIAWFTKYINNLAGKTHDLDRLLREMTPDETMRVLNILNTRAKKNAVYGNLSSALVQAGNFPVGLSLAVKNGGKQTAQDLTKGMVNYLRDIKNGVRAQDSSTLLALRYFNANLKDARLSANLDNLGSWMMEALDKTTAETLWYTFKAQGERLGVADPLAYADEMVDRSIQSRRPEDMPLSQQSEIIKLVAPFQVEVNNQWQVMKDLFKGATKGDNKTRNFAGIVALMISSALMNIGFEKLINRKPLFDPLSAIYEAISDPEATDAQITGRVLGELLGAIPGGQYLPSLLGLDSDEAEKFFGESDPSRYGVGNMGLSAIMDLLTSAGDDNATRKALENIFFTYVMPGWGKQTQRVLKGSQDFGYLPKYVNGEWRRDPIHYTSTGGVGFVNDPKDVFDYMKSLVGGQYATKAGREYIESDFKKLGVGTLKDANGKTISSSQALQVRKELQDLGVYDDVVEQIQSGKMTPAKAGLSDKVINMNDEEFDSAYNSMLAKAEGISNQLREMYNWDDNKEQEYQKAIDIEADYKDGKKVTDSEALKTRKALEEAGIYQDVIDYIAQNGLDYTDVGLGKRVVGYDQDKFAEIYAKKIGGGN